MKTTVEAVIGWFADHCEELAEIYGEVRFGFASAGDPVSGKANLGLSGVSAAASITFWNKGDVEVLVLDLKSKETTVLDDRRLEKDEDAESLMTSYAVRVRSMLP